MLLDVLFTIVVLSGIFFFPKLTLSIVLFVYGHWVLGVISIIWLLRD